MQHRKHKIPLLLKLKRFKNSADAELLNNFLSMRKPPEKFNGIPERILLIRNDRIGDAAVTLPVIRDLKLNYPSLVIDVLVSDVNKFVFDELDYIDNVIEYNHVPAKLNPFFKIPFLGSVLQFKFYELFPLFYSSARRNEIRYLKNRKYDAVIDLVGMKRNIFLGKLISKYTAGPRKLGVCILYNYYIDSNWVSPNDTASMSLKIERLFVNAFGFSFAKRNTSQPFVSFQIPANSIQKHDVVVHIGTSELRKLPFETEKKLIAKLSRYRLLITDSSESERFKELKKEFVHSTNIEFNTFPTLKELASHCYNAKLLICYDGGQAHYISQFVKTLVIFGPGSVALWKPNDFSEYRPLKMFANGVKTEISDGKHKHTVIYFPIWCRPCFDVGCQERPCLASIKAEQIVDLVNNYCLNDD